MTGKSFRGKDHCYVCGNELHWHCPADPDSAGMLQNLRLAQIFRLI